MPYTHTRNNTELWLDTADPSRRFDNMLYNRAYMTMIDQCGRGGGKHMTEEGLTNNLIAGGRILYIRDDATGEFFSAGWAPVFKDYTSYRCGSGFNYQIIENVTDGLKVTWRIYVPAGDDPVEVWDVRVADVSGKARKVSLFTFAEMNCDGFDLYGGFAVSLCQVLPRDQRHFRPSGLCAASGGQLPLAQRLSGGRPQGRCVGCPQGEVHRRQAQR